MPDYGALAKQIGAEYGLDPDMFWRQINTESRFDPRAYNAKSGASGIAQIVPRWHPGVNVWDPVASMRYAANWVATMVRNTGSLPYALVAYNWGPGNAASWDRKSRSFLPEETRNYLDAIIPGWDGGDQGGGDDDDGDDDGGDGGGGGWLPDIGAIRDAIREGIEQGSEGIGAGIVAALGNGARTIWSGFVRGGRDAIIDRVAPAGMGVAGVALVGWGLTAAAVRSAPGQLAVNVASAVPDPRVRAGAAAARVVGGR